MTWACGLSGREQTDSSCASVLLPGQEAGPWQAPVCGHLADVDSDGAGISGTQVRAPTPSSHPFSLVTSTHSSSGEKEMHSL